MSLFSYLATTSVWIFLCSTVDGGDPIRKMSIKMWRVDAECWVFRKSWTDEHFFFSQKLKPCAQFAVNTWLYSNATTVTGRKKTHGTIETVIASFRLQKQQGLLIKLYAKREGNVKKKKKKQFTKWPKGASRRLASKQVGWHCGKIWSWKTRHPSIFMKGIIKDYEITISNALYVEINTCMQKFGLQWEMLGGVAAEGCPPVS